ncbi:DEAD/DEAH box helicase [Georgenia sp. Z1344]|uniref:DEAD/DEAH box helicase n=1 Tax=Georgenia sp. Z1344 TaxID=3416706 RepID=UPI003CF6752E
MSGGPAPDGFSALHPVIQHHVVNTLGWPSLRPLQEQSIGPLMRGHDALLLAPTAGGKTEAAMFPLLSRAEQESWRGVSVLYVTPLKALINNLEPRLDGYASWLGRSAQVRHGDTTQGARKRQLTAPPDILLTTPESVESMLVSVSVDAHQVFSELRAVIVDEVHAFAGDDRGWHLLAVLERLSRVAGRPLQRVGLSATVGNAPELLAWLQGSNARRGVEASVVAPSSGIANHSHSARPSAPPSADLELDYVGTVDNAATVVAALHHGEKRLVFTDSRRTVEEMSLALRERNVETYVSHSSLSVDERRRAEEAFTVARDCVIVSTSTLELGIDVGDLDRVIQVGAPSTVASLLQRLGRTGRRAGTSRNMIFLETDDQAFLRAAGLLLLWSEGFVEPVVAPPVPRHILAQQLIGIALQEGRVGEEVWPEWLGKLRLAPADDVSEIVQWLLDEEHLDLDGGMLFVGPEAERRYGKVHFRDLMAVFTADPEFLVLHGRNEIGSVDPTVLTRKVEGPRRVTLGGRAWLISHIDWTRRVAFVEPSDHGADPRWLGTSQPYSFELAQAIRRILLGNEPEGVSLTGRARRRLDALRAEYSGRVDLERTVVRKGETRTRWWTWAGSRANAVLAACLDAIDGEILGDTMSFDNFQIALRSDVTAFRVSEAMVEARREFGDDLRGALPIVDERAVRQLKFAEMLPPSLATATLAARGADHVGAAQVQSAIQGDSMTEGHR